MADDMPPPGAPTTPAEPGPTDHVALARLALSTWTWPAAQGRPVPPPEPVVAEPEIAPLDPPLPEPDSTDSAEPVLPELVHIPPVEVPPPPALRQDDPTPLPPPAPVAPPEPARWYEAVLPPPAVFEAYRAAGGQALVDAMRQQCATEATHRRELERRQAMLARTDAVLLRLLPAVVMLGLLALCAIVARHSLPTAILGGAVVVLLLGIWLMKAGRTSFSEEKEAKRLSR